MKHKSRVMLTTEDLAGIFHTTESSVRRMISEGSLRLTGNGRRDFFAILGRLVDRNKRVVS